MRRWTVAAESSPKESLFLSFAIDITESYGSGVQKKTPGRSISPARRRQFFNCLSERRMPLRLRCPVAFTGTSKLRHGRLTAEFDAILFVDRDDLNVHRIANAADVANAGDILVRKLADVAEAILARQDLDKCTKVFDARDGAVVDAADL